MESNGFCELGVLSVSMNEAHHVGLDQPLRLFK